MADILCISRGQACKEFFKGLHPSPAPSGSPHQSTLSILTKGKDSSKTYFQRLDG